MTYRDCLVHGKNVLEKAGIGDPAMDAWLLFSGVFQMDRTSYYIHSNDTAEQSKVLEYDGKLKRRENKEPLQYIEGLAWFMGFEFLVSDAVLIPRFDTEILVEEALKCLKPQSHVLDMCTGSGCIALSVAMLRTDSNVDAVDVSVKALEVARSNQAKHHSDNVRFLESDMFTLVDAQYDMIISNPPYIPTDVIAGLDWEVKNCEPFMALDGHGDGLYFYRILASEGYSHLKDGGILIMEIGHDQGIAVSGLLMDNNFADVKVIKDLAGLDRVVCGWRK